MLVLVMSFSYNSDDTFSKVFLLVTLLMLVFCRGVFLALLMLILVRCFTYTPDASVNEFVLQSSC